MSKIPTGLPKVEQEQRAKANRSDIPNTGLDQTDSVESGGGNPKIPQQAADTKQVLFFSRELAVKLNPKRPDFTGAIILYGLYLWQKARISSRFGYVPMVNDERGSYRSLSQLNSDYPWRTEEGIRQILIGAEVSLKGDFIIDRNNAGAERGKFHYHLSKDLIKKYGFTKGVDYCSNPSVGLIAVEKGDVIKYGILGAILIYNLRYVTDETRNKNPVTDENGNIYRELSPTALTKPRKDKNGVMKPILPVVRKTVTKALTVLCSANVFREHPTKKNFFRLTTDEEKRLASVTKVAGDVTRVARRVTKVASDVTIVAGQNEGMARKQAVSNDLQPIVKTPDSNTDSNPDCNADRKCVFPCSVSPCSTAHGLTPKLSPNAAKLKQLITEGVNAKRQAPHSAPRCTSKDFQCFWVSDCDKWKITYWDLPYDIIVPEWYTGKPYNRSAELDHFMEAMIMEIKMSGLPYTKKDLRALRNVFEHHPLLTPEALAPVIRSHTPVCWVDGKPIPVPKKGHDDRYFARRITNMKQFLRYLPQLVRECYIKELGSLGDHVFFEEGKEGRRVYDYKGMREPLLSLAFENELKIPVTQKRDEDEDGNMVFRDIFYPEFVRLPRKEYVTIDCNPISWPSE
jgi:hypothetical protein